MHRHFRAKTQAAGSASVQISRLRTRKLANEGCFGIIDRWRIPDSVRARPAARHTTSHLQKPASASCADSKAMASSAIGRAHRVSSSFVVGPGRPRPVRTREEHDTSPPPGEEANERKRFSTTTHLETQRDSRRLERWRSRRARSAAPARRHPKRPLEYCASRAAQGAAIAQR